MFDAMRAVARFRHNLLKNQRLFTKATVIYRRTMSIFTQSFDPITGATIWEEKDPNYDYHQEVARSAFADMLHDHERNIKYYAALKKAIEKKHKSGEKAHVLDIGTGTGLLSMMAAKCGADTITACEAFKPMADCAVEILKDNRLDLKINLVRKRSTEMTVGTNGDMLHRANILVTEVFDTELIGEGALSTFKHAHEVLLEKDCIVVPSSGTVWVQVVESDSVRAWNRVRGLIDPKTGELLVQAPSQVNNCSGSAAVHDIQLTQLPLEEFKPLLPPQKLFTFDWSGKQQLVFDEQKTRQVQAIASGTVHALFMWWDLDMDEDGEILLSCAPVWEHPDAKNSVIKGSSWSEMADKIPWRDHWMQAIYYFPQEIKVALGDAVYLTGYHDEYSFWFQVGRDSLPKLVSSHVCVCSLHLAFSRTRIGQLNDLEKNEKYVRALQKHVKPDTVCLSISDGSLLGLAAAKLGARRVIVFEPNYLSRKVLESFILTNSLVETVQIIESVEELKNLADVSLVIGEPYFVNSILPWDNLRFWYLASKYAPGVPTISRGARLRGVAVEFKDLHKIRAPLGVCEGFDLTTFDKLVSDSSEISDNPVEAQPLWEYPAAALSPSFDLATFDFNREFSDSVEASFSGEIPINASGSCNGIALWMDWTLDDQTTITTGPTSPIEPGKRISWDLNTRQGVFLLRNIQKVDEKHTLSWSLKHHFRRDRSFIFNFCMKSKS